MELRGEKQNKEERIVLKQRQTVTSFIESENEILILLRSEYVRTHKGLWSGISGPIEKGKTADEQALVEIEEETSLHREQVELVRKGKPQFIVNQEHRIRKVVYPYLFHIKDRARVRINWEHKGIAWIKPEDIDNYRTVPELKETLTRVLS